MSRFRLVALDADLSFELAPGTRLSVGRAVTSDVAIVDPTVSRHHADLVTTTGGVELHDVGSSNGSFHNGVKVDRAVAVAGDTVTFGKVAFRVERVAPAPEPTTRDGDRAALPGGTIVRPIPAQAGLQASGALEAVKQATDEGEKDRRKLAILLEVSKGLTRAADIDALLERIADYVVQILEADRCAILLMAPDGTLVPTVARDSRGAGSGDRVPQSIVRTAVQDKVALLTEDAGEDARFTGQSILMQQVRSALCAPLIGSDGAVLGVLYVDNFSLARRFGESDLDFLIAFAGIASVALENGQFAERIRVESLARSNFERFFTPQLAARIATSADAVRLGGEKRQVAVLFSDIRGFTALSETMTPDDIARLLTEYFSEMVECVFAHGGTLDKFIGDAVMAQWGAPLGEPDDVDRAMRAALEMMHRLDTLNARWRLEGRPEIAIGIGVNVGEVFAGNIGSERRLEYTVIGDTVNTASRLCSAAQGGEIIISGAVRAALQVVPPLETLEPMALKGKAQPLAVFRVRR